MSLEAEFRTTIARLSLVSAGTIYSYNPIGTGSGFKGSAPVSGDPDMKATIQGFVDRWNAGEDQRAVLTAARKELDSLRKRQEVKEGETPAERVKRIIADGKGLSLSEAATKFRASEREIRNVRKAKNVAVEDGKPMSAAFGSDRASAANALRRAGYSTREIAARLGTHQKQVMRWVRTAA